MGSHKKGGGPYSGMKNGGPYRGVKPKQPKNSASQNKPQNKEPEPQGAAEPKQVIAVAPQSTAPAPQNNQPTPQNNQPAPQGNEPAQSPKQRFFSIYNIIGLVLCILLLPGFIISATLLVSSWIHPDLPPSFFGLTPLMVETGSMSPVFDEDDLVLIQNSADDASYSVGDIICFRSGNAYVTHRIKEIETDENGNTVYITQGDANNAPDTGSVRPDQILGVFKTRLKGMGGVFVFIQTPGGMIVCVMLPIILVLLLFFVPPLLAARKKTEAPAHSERSEESP